MPNIIKYRKGTSALRPGMNIQSVPSFPIKVKSLRSRCSSGGCDGGAPRYRWGLVFTAEERPCISMSLPAHLIKNATLPASPVSAQKWYTRAGVGVGECHCDCKSISYIWVSEKHLLSKRNQLSLCSWIPTPRFPRSVRGKVGTADVEIDHVEQKGWSWPQVGPGWLLELWGFSISRLTPASFQSICPHPCSPRQTHPPRVSQGY